MSLHPPVRRAALSALAVVLTLGVAGVLARPTAGHPAPSTVAPAARSAVDAARVPSQGGVVVQVRDFPGASIIAVVAWSAAAPSYGLRTFVRRSGAPDRYHYLWVSVDMPNGRDVTLAKGLNRPLQVSTGTETQNCWNNVCSPASTFSARLPDAPFRAAKEDVAVNFATGSGAEINLTARRALIDAYLGTVDSLVAALKK